MEKILYVMRGIPGSGKSYTAQEYVRKENIFSTDEFWGPEYKFDITKLGIAHTWNQTRVKRAMADNLSPIAVDNTNITLKEIKPYVKLAKEYGYNVIFKEPNSPWWREVKEFLEQRKSCGLTSYDWASTRCVKILLEHGTHNVPEQTIIKMLTKWQSTEEIEQSYRKYNEV